MNLLLDTNVFIWMQEGNERLPVSWRNLILNPAHQKSLSMASLWEIAIKTNLGKLEFTIPLWEAVPSEIALLPIQITHLVEVQRLPLHHRDPFDRLLIAQALAEGLTIMTADDRFRSYDVPLV
jgi:PIN domain nuclease of toxin-antitoxin system